MQQQEAPVNLDVYVPDEQEDDDTQKEQGSRVKYQKLMQQGWGKLENKNFSTFELRVLDTLFQLGDQTANKILVPPKEVLQPKEEQKVEKKQQQKKKGKQEEELKTEQKQEKPISKFYEICVGSDLYLQIIRPKLLEVKIVGKLQEQKEQQDDGEEEETNPNDKKDKKKKDKKPGASKKKGTKGAVKKDDELRLLLSRDKLNDASIKMLEMMGILFSNQEIKLIEEEFLRVEQAAKRIKSLKWLEMRFAALLGYATQIINCHLESKIREEYAFELIYFLKNVYIKYQDYQGTSYADNEKQIMVAPQVMIDVRKKLTELNKHFHFSNRLLFNRYPRLVIDTDLNQSFQQTDIKPYKAQIELMDLLQTIAKPTLFFLNTMVGTGKTVLSVSITQFLQKIRETKKSQSEEANEEMEKNSENMLFKSNLDQLQVLYCCPLDNVRTQVGAAAYQKKLPFGIASMWKDPNSKSQKLKDDNKDLGYVECPRIVNSWSARTQPFPSLIISDFQTTLELLKERYTVSEKEKTVIRWQGKKKETLKENPAKNGDQYILFIDEPTVDADQANAEITQMLVQIMRYAPPITILSSATLPPPERLPNFIKLFSKRNGGDIDIKTILSTQFQIGCQIFSHKGQKFLPHYKVTNKEQLSTVLKRLEQNPFMQRCYNANAYCELHDRMKNLNFEGVEDFEQFDLITQEIVQKKSIELLNRLSKEDDQTIQKVCQETLPDEDLDDEEDGTLEINYNDKQQPKKQEKIDDEDKIKFAAPYKNLKLRELAGKMAHTFSGGCLIAVNDPIKQVRKNFNWLLKNIRPASDYIKHYEKSLETLQKLKEKKEKDIDNEDERSKAVQAIEEGMNLSIDFPDNKKINTLEHYKVYQYLLTETKRFVAGSNVQLLHKYRARKAYSLEGINFNLGIPDDILLYLFSGIACYSEKVLFDKFIKFKPSFLDQLSQDYMEEVQNLSSNGQLALIVSDDSMCYGVNYPLNHVIVYDEMANQRSMGAIFQLIGRAGRVGVSWVANAYLEEQTFQRLVNYLEGNNQDADERLDEAYNMELQAKKLIENLIATAKAKRAQQIAEVNV